MTHPNGIVPFEAAGRSWTLQFTTNAICLLEDKIDKSTLEIATELEFNPRMATIRAMFWAACGDDTLTMAAVGQMIDDVGIKEAIAIAKKAFSAAFPDAEEAKGTGNPPGAAAAG